MNADEVGRRLLACRDADFAWMLGEGPGRPGLTLPPGGVDTPGALEVVRSINAAAGDDADPATWLLVVGAEVVGLCGRVRSGPPGGDAEIGYSVAPARRRQGYAAWAVGRLSALLLADPAIGAVTAVTAVDNAPSQKALTRNGFVETGRETRDDDGPVILWRLTRRAFPRPARG